MSVWLTPTHVVAVFLFYWAWGIIAEIALTVADVLHKRRSFPRHPENWTTITLADGVLLVFSTLFFAQLATLLIASDALLERSKTIILWQDRPVPKDDISTSQAASPEAKQK